VYHRHNERLYGRLSNRLSVKARGSDGGSLLGARVVDDQLAYILDAIEASEAKRGRSATFPMP
jgi:hypothetical protein